MSQNLQLAMYQSRETFKNFYITSLSYHTLPYTQGKQSKSPRAEAAASSAQCRNANATKGHDNLLWIRVNYKTADGLTLHSSSGSHRLHEV